MQSLERFSGLRRRKLLQLRCGNGRRDLCPADAERRESGLPWIIIEIIIKLFKK